MPPCSAGLGFLSPLYSLLLLVDSYAFIVINAFIFNNEGLILPYYTLICACKTLPVERAGEALATLK
jgi:hypothetical protein